MAGQTILIHYNGGTESFQVNDINALLVTDLLRHAQDRLYGEFTHIAGDSSDYLCEGPYSTKPIDDCRLREIVKMVRGLPPPFNLNETSEVVQKPIELWLCNCNTTTFVYYNH